ncbi:MAG: 2-succinyl-5-enolpyruvyl-6-hydroxy-3-cyclohexene-1-carboxylate synthase, partial [Acidimicrobiaceae bacterium]|nr:2-succinyl-5-enolpyruvyl-6-hydroxy-3-cyclohexene-1-carboxylate synthase [Acidimicrobiaceae bacterium]
MVSDLVYDTVASFAAGLVEQGVTDVVISPGSRSTPLALTLHAQPRLRTWIQLDERSAGFFALGQARRTGRPSVLVSTSGTAAANYLPAVIEAHHAGVPMIVCTADRPPELRDWGSPQTIDQVKIYGAATRWAADLAVAGEWTPTQGRLIAHRAVVSATGIDPGPVHLNWPLREPLEPIAAVPVVDAPAPATPGASTAPGESAWRAPATPGASTAPGESAWRA